MTNTKKFTVAQLSIMAEEVNAQNSALEYLEYYPMEMLEEMLYGADIEKVITMVQYGDFRLSDDLFGFDGRGNLKSLSEIEYDNLLNEYHDEIVGA